jgi:dCTP deaminase
VLESHTVSVKSYTKDRLGCVGVYIGMILTGPEIEKQVGTKRIQITPFDRERLNPASYDVSLGNQVAVYTDWVECYEASSDDGRYFVAKPGKELDSKKELATKTFTMDPVLGWVIKPGLLYLMHTAEVISTDHYVPIIDGKSSVGRLGIVVHLTAGFGDPAFNGQYTLEVTAVHPIRVYPGMRFCQVRFHKMEGNIQLYAGNYTGEAAMGPVASRSWRQFK